MPQTVLIVDDDPSVRTTLARTLEAGGYATRSAANGREALDDLRTNPLPCLILLDLCMPVMDGWQFRQEQAQDPALRHIPVVIVSGKDQLPAKAEAWRAAACPPKPMDLGELLTVVRR